MSGIRAGQASISFHVVSLMVILGYLTDEDLSTVGLFTQWLAILKESVPWEQGRSYEPSHDLTSEGTQHYLYHVLLVTQDWHKFTLVMNCTKMWIPKRVIYYVCACITYICTHAHKESAITRLFFFSSWHLFWLWKKEKVFGLGFPQ